LKSCRVSFSLVLCSNLGLAQLAAEFTTHCCDGLNPFVICPLWTGSGKELKMDPSKFGAPHLKSLLDLEKLICFVEGVVGANSHSRSSASQGAKPKLSPPRNGTKQEHHGRYLTFPHPFTTLHL
jgi:hypothetical protein